MKKLFALVLALVMLLALCACGQQAAPAAAPAAEAPAAEAPAEEAAPAEAAPVQEDQKIEIKIAGIKTDEDPASIAMQAFADEVNANSDTITVKVYTNSVLGGANDLLSGMTDGTVEMFYNTLSCYPWVSGAEVFTALSAPFLWDDNAELEAFLATDEAQAWFDAAAEQSGVKCLVAEGELVPRELTSNKPVYTAADFQGLKVRTAESKIVQETMKKLGAQTQTIALADLYMALRQGTVDAQENGWIGVKSNSFYEVQKYYMQTDYIRDVSAIFISNELWNSMSETQQQVVLTAAKNAVHLEEATIRAQLDDVLAFLDEHMEKIDIDVASVQEALGADFYDQFDGDLWPEGTMAVINAFKASYAG